jgi:uncharacterized membrane protein
MASHRALAISTGIFFEFLFVFLILITSWIIHTSDMSVLPIETRLVTFLNVVLLILVAIIPYLFDQVVSTVNATSVQNYASILFTADFAGTLLIMAIFAHIIAQEEEHLVDGEIMVRLRRVRNVLSFLTVVVLVARCPVGLARSRSTSPASDLVRSHNQFLA